MDGGWLDGQEMMFYNFLTHKKPALCPVLSSLAARAKGRPASEKDSL